MNKILTKLIAAFTAGICLCGAVPCKSTQHSAVTANAASSEETGEIDGYTYEVFDQNGTGSFEYENTENNGYSVSWKNNEYSYAFKGKVFERDTISAYQVEEYKIDYDIDVAADGYIFAGVTGYFTNLSARFNILEVGSDDFIFDNAKKLSDVTIGDMTYEMYESRYGVSMHDSGYPDYWSIAKREPIEVGEERHVSGTIDIAAHFRAWSEAGLKLGFITEIGFAVEPYRCSGYAKLNSMDTRSKISDKQVYGPPMPVRPYEPHDPLEIGEDGKIINVDFESESDKFGAVDQGSGSELSGEHSYSGEKSLYLSDPHDPGAPSFFYELDPYDLPQKSQANNDFITGARIFHNAGEDISFEFQLVEYSEDLFEYHFVRELGSRTCSSGQWTNIDDIFFELSHDVLKKYRIVIVPSKAVEFYIDDFFIGKGDTNKEGIKNTDTELRGDLNSDGIIDSFDIAVCRRAVLRSLAKGIIETEGDVNGDFKSNVSDLVLLTRYVLHISDEIPLAEGEAVLYKGNKPAYNKTGKRCVEALDDKYNDDRTKTVVRKDGSFTAEWNDANYYTCSGYVDYSETFEKKSCKDFNISYSADLRSSGKTDMQIRAYVQTDSGDLSVTVNEGWMEHGVYTDHDAMIKNADDLEVVTLNGTEYYMSVFTDEFSDQLELCRKDNPLVVNENCRIENQFSLEEILKLWGEAGENTDRVCKLEMFIISDDSSGYVDFRELKFTENESLA